MYGLIKIISLFITFACCLLNIYVTDLLPLMDLSRTDLDEDIMSPNNLQCIVDHKNMKLESHGYKIGTSSIDF